MNTKTISSKRFQVKTVADPCERFYNFTKLLLILRPITQVVVNLTT